MESDLEFQDPFAEQIEALADEELARTEAARAAEQDERDKLASEDLIGSEDEPEVHTLLWGGGVESPLRAFDRIYQLFDELGEAVETVESMAEHSDFVIDDEYVTVRLNVVEATVTDAALQLFGLIGNERAREDATALSKKITSLVVARRDSEEFKAKMAPYVAQYEEHRAKVAVQQAAFIESLRESFGEGVQVLTEDEFVEAIKADEADIDPSVERVLDAD